MSVDGLFERMIDDTFCCVMLRTTDDSEIRDTVMNNFKREEKQHLQSYLLEIIVGRYNEVELNALVRKANNDLLFLRPGGTTRYLTKVSEWLAEDLAE